MTNIAPTNHYFQNAFYLVDFLTHIISPVLTSLHVYLIFQMPSLFLVIKLTYLINQEVYCEHIRPDTKMRI